MSVGLRVQKFNTVSNDHGRTQKCDFSVLDWKYSLGTLGAKNSNMQNSLAVFTFPLLDQKYLFEQIWSKKLKNTEFSDGLHFFCFRPKIPFLANLVQKSKLVLVIAWFRLQLTINLTSGNQGAS